MRRGRVVAALVAATATAGLAVPAQAAEAPATGSTWTKLVDLRIVSTKGSSDIDSAAHVQRGVDVAGVHYERVLAGSVAAGATGVAIFDLGRRCSRFTTSVGLSDDSPRKGSITFSVYFGDVAEVVKEPKHGRTLPITLDVTGVKRLVLRNTEPDPAESLPGPVGAAWPGAKVRCRS